MSIGFPFSLFPLKWFMLLEDTFSIFLWAGKSDSFKFHLVAWEGIASPKLYGGWGLKNLFFFNQALCAKSLWRVLFSRGFCHKVIRSKYIECPIVCDWIWNPSVNSVWLSAIWRSLLKVLPILKNHFCWMVGRGVDVILGIDPVSSMDGSFSLSIGLLKEIHHTNILVLS